MRKLLLIILMIPALCRAQDTTKMVFLDTTAVHFTYVRLPLNKEITDIKTGRWTSYAILTSSVLSNAVGDGLNSRQYYAQGHALNAFAVGGLLTYPFVNKVSWKTPVTYILVRYALFDLFYNVGAHRNLNYRGGKNYYNQGLGHVPLAAVDATKILSLALSVYINIK